MCTECITVVWVDLNNSSPDFWQEPEDNIHEKLDLAHGMLRAEKNPGRGLGKNEEVALKGMSHIHFSFVVFH